MVGELVELEIETEAELHPAGNREQCVGYAEVASGKTGANKGGVEAHTVGDVVNFPGEFKRAILANLPHFGQAGVDVEVSVAAEVVALPRFTRVGEANRSARCDAVVDGIGILEELRVASGIEVLMDLDRVRDNAEALNLPVGGPAGFGNREWQAAGPPVDTGPLPAAHEGIDKTVGAAQNCLSAAEGSKYTQSAVMRCRVSKSDGPRLR